MSGGHLPKRIAASQSFTPGEVAWLAQLMETMTRGGDTRILMRSPMCRAVMRKVHVMKKRLAEVEAERAQEKAEREKMIKAIERDDE